jgi:hypothetical protein
MQLITEEMSVSSLDSLGFQLCSLNLFLLYCLISLRSIISMTLAINFTLPCGSVSQTLDNFIIFSGTAAQRGLWPPHQRGSFITYNDASQLVGLLWMSALNNVSVEILFYSLSLSGCAL